jgi:hypothetical protein
VADRGGAVLVEARFGVGELGLICGQRGGVEGGAFEERVFEAAALEQQTFDVHGALLELEEVHRLVQVDSPDQQLILLHQLLKLCTLRNPFLQL